MTLPWMALVLTLWAVVVALLVVVLGLLRRMGPVLEAAERTLRTTPTMPGELGGLRAGAVVPDCTLTAVPGGHEREFREFLGRGSVVLFVQHHCPACTALLRALEEDPEALAGTRLLVVGDPDEAAELAGLADPGRDIHVAIQRDGTASRAFDQRAFPHAFATDATGTVVAQLIPSTVDDMSRLGARLRDRALVADETAGQPTDRGGPP